MWQVMVLWPFNMAICFVRYTSDTWLAWQLRLHDKNLCANNTFDMILFLMLKGLIPRALFLGEMRNISPVSFEL